MTKESFELWKNNRDVYDALRTYWFNKTIRDRFTLKKETGWKTSEELFPWVAARLDLTEDEFNRLEEIHGPWD